MASDLAESGPGTWLRFIFRPPDLHICSIYFAAGGRIPENLRECPEAAPYARETFCQIRHAIHNLTDSITLANEKWHWPSNYSCRAFALYPHTAKCCSVSKLPRGILPYMPAWRNCCHKFPLSALTKGTEQDKLGLIKFMKRKAWKGRVGRREASRDPGW